MALRVRIGISNPPHFREGLEEDRKGSGAAGTIVVASTAYDLLIRSRFLFTLILFSVSSVPLWFVSQSAADAPTRYDPVARCPSCINLWRCEFLHQKRAK